MSERAETVSSSGLALEARLHLPDGDGPHPAVTVCHPHPQYGGEMNNNVVLAIGAALLERGIAVLRFNFRGVGRSTGAHDGGRGEVEDAATVVAHLTGLPEIDGGRVGLAGYSFGAAMAQHAARDGVRALALVSCPVSMLDRDRLAGFPGPLLLMTGGNDQFSPEASFREVAHGLGPAAETAAIAGADHFWWGHERDLAGVVGPFFARALGATGGS